TSRCRHRRSRSGRRSSTRRPTAAQAVPLIPPPQGEGKSPRQERIRQMDATTPQTTRTLTHRETMLIVLGVMLPVFMGSLDNTILASALPTIGREFGDVHNLPWLVTAYLIANTSITALYGKISDIRGRRVTLLIAISMYMLGSIVCALAPNMVVLIFGRVLHGLGGGGLTSTGMVVLGDIAAPKDRGKYYGYFS